MDATEFATAELKKTLEGLARHLFGSEIQTRWGAHSLRRNPGIFGLSVEVDFLLKFIFVRSLGFLGFEWCATLLVGFPGCLMPTLGLSWCWMLTSRVKTVLVGLFVCG